MAGFKVFDPETHVEGEFVPAEGPDPQEAARAYYLTLDQDIQNQVETGGMEFNLHVTDESGREFVVAVSGHTEVTLTFGLRS